MSRTFVGIRVAVELVLFHSDAFFPQSLSISVGFQPGCAGHGHDEEEDADAATHKGDHLKKGKYRKLSTITSGL